MSRNRSEDFGSKMNPTRHLKANSEGMFLERPSALTRNTDRGIEEVCKADPQQHYIQKRKDLKTAGIGTKSVSQLNQKGRFFSQRDTLSGQKAQKNLPANLSKEISQFEVLPRVMALKASKYRRILREPKSTDYNIKGQGSKIIKNKGSIENSASSMLVLNDPSKTNNRFVNTCKNSTKSSFGGGFKVKKQEETFKFLPLDIFINKESNLNNYDLDLLNPSALCLSDHKRVFSQQSMRIRKIKTKEVKHRKSVLENRVLSTHR